MFGYAVRSTPNLVSLAMSSASSRSACSQLLMNFVGEKGGCKYLGAALIAIIRTLPPASGARARISPGNSKLRNVPEGRCDRSLARSAWDGATLKEPSRRVRCDWCRCARRFDDWSDEIQTFPNLRNFAWQQGYGAFSVGISRTSLLSSTTTILTFDTDEQRSPNTVTWESSEF